jgi:ATP-dependent Lhr-like helicase
MSERSMAQWLAARGWEPFDYQQQAWAAYRGGRSGLIHAPTGMGKTYAAWGGPIDEWLSEAADISAGPALIRVLWVTPLRALASDIAAALRQPVEAMGLPWSVELRTGDTPSSRKQRQKKRLPTALVTTPESLSLLLSYPGRGSASPRCGAWSSTNGTS